MSWSKKQRMFGVIFYWYWMDNADANELKVHVVIVTDLQSINVEAIKSK